MSKIHSLRDAWQKVAFPVLEATRRSPKHFGDFALQGKHTRDKWICLRRQVETLGARGDICHGSHKLKKSLNGLKQSSWNPCQRLKSKRKKAGFPSMENANPCLFISNKATCLALTDVSSFQLSQSGAPQQDHPKAARK